MKKNYVFVYGSLKHNHGNHCILENEPFVDFAISYKNTYIMRSNGGFPMVRDTGTINQHTYSLAGEIYELTQVSTVMDLDSLEGNGFLYRREEREFILWNTDEVVSAWVYLYMYSLDYRHGTNKRFREHNKDLTVYKDEGNTNYKLVAWEK